MVITSKIATRKASEWLRWYKIKFIDPDGFRDSNGVFLDTIMDRREFSQRLEKCTLDSHGFSVCDFIAIELLEGFE